MTQPRRVIPTEGYYISPADRQRERQAEHLRREFQRDQERKEAARRGRAEAIRAYRGIDYLGRPYDDIARTGAWRERPELRRPGRGA